MTKRAKESTQVFLRNFVFGVEDSLVSTVGLLSGIAVAGVNSKTIFTTGLVLILVEAFSMGIGSFLSEDSAEELVQKRNRTGLAISGALVMFASYSISGFIPLSPYLLFPKNEAFVYSILFSLVALFTLGAWSAARYRGNVLKRGIKTVFLGGMAIIAGIIIGRLLPVS